MIQYECDKDFETHLNMFMKDKISEKVKVFKLHLQIFLIVCLSVVFMWYVDVCVNNWNRDTQIYNKEIKDYCPCEKWLYVTKGIWVCDCPTNTTK